MMYIKTFALFVLTALAEIAGCYGVWLVVRKGLSVWYLVPSLLILLLFAWLLCWHPMGAGRTFAAYGGVYVAAALVWGVAMEGLQANFSDWAGAALCLCGAAIIVLGAES